MSRAEDFKRLAKEMENAYEERVSRISEIKADTKKLIEQFRRENKEATSAWKDLVSAMKAKRGIKPKPEVTPEEGKVKPEERPEEEEEKLLEKAKEEAGEVEEGLKEQVLKVIKERPEGLKMTQMADIMGLKNWRVLIPVARSLLDEGRLRKEGSLYFSSE